MSKQKQEIHIRYCREGRKHVYYSPDIPGLKVSDADKMMAFYLVSAAIEEHFNKVFERACRVTPPGTFAEVSQAYGPTGHGPTGSGAAPAQRFAEQRHRI